MALTLRAVAGLSTAQIARGFLVPEATMAQRISRAKARLREVGARFTPPVAEQDRTRWDPAAIREGTALVEAALPTGPVGPFQLQAAVAAVHAEASRPEDTDRAQSETLYRMLSDLAPSPVVRLNHAVALAMVDGPSDGLEMLAHLLERDGRTQQARASYAVAASLATSIPEQHYLNGKAAHAHRPA